VGRRRPYIRRSRWDVVRVALGTLVGFLIGFLIGFLVGLIDGSQQGEWAAPSAPRTVIVEKTVV
jgi:hypothetical protein